MATETLTTIRNPVTPDALERLIEELQQERRTIAAVLDGGICIVSPEITRLCARRERLDCAAGLARSLSVCLHRLGVE